MDTVIGTVLVGLGATVVVDAWALARRRLLGLPLPNYGLVGRWFGHMAWGRFRHAAIAAATPVRGEALLGWTAHYAIGIAFAAVLMALFGSNWLQQPRLLPALAVSIGSVVAPWMLMQPGMGQGVAARFTSSPRTTRLHNLLTHAVFGLGLYATGLALTLFPPTGS